MAKGRYKSTSKRTEIYRAVTMQHYEEGNQSKCYKAVWRNFIYPMFGISYRTYLNHINAKPTTDYPQTDRNQLSLF